MNGRRSYFADAEIIASMNKVNSLLQPEDLDEDWNISGVKRSDSVIEENKMPEKLVISKEEKGDYQLRHEVFYNSIYEEFIKEYGMDDSEKTKRHVEYKDLLELNPKFNWILFFEFFSYHLLQLFLLGPFFGLLMSVLPKYRPFMRNLNFSPAFNRYYIAYLIIYICNISIILSLIKGKHPLLTDMERYFCFINNLFTLAVICFNYGALSSEKIKYLKQYRISERIFKQENMMGDWAAHKDQKIYHELINSVRRHELDLSLFYCNFAVNPSESLLKKINSNLQRLSMQHKRKSHIFQPVCLAEDSSCIMVFGYAIFYEMIKAFEKKQRKRLFMKILYVYIFWRTFFIPYYYLWMQMNPLVGANFLDILTLVLYLLCINMFCFIIFLHLSIYCIDLMRTLHSLIQLTYLLISQKQEQEFKEVKLFPTINIYCHMNLKSWMSLRKIVMNYGCKYNIIGDKALMLGCICMVNCLVLIILHTLHVYELTNREIALMCFDAISFGAILFTLFFIGAFINDHFRIHINTLEKNKNICADLQRLSVYYFDRNSNPENFLYERGIFVMRKHYGDDLNLIYKHLNQVIGITECGINDLSNDELNHPFQVFHLSVSTVMIRNILVAIASLFVAFAQSMIKNWIS